MKNLDPWAQTWVYSDSLERQMRWQCVCSHSDFSSGLAGADISVLWIQCHLGILEKADPLWTKHQNWAFPGKKGWEDDTEASVDSALTLTEQRVHQIPWGTRSQEAPRANNSQFRTMTTSEIASLMPSTALRLKVLGLNLEQLIINPIGWC